MLGSILVLGPAKLLHITGTIFFFPVVELTISCYFRVYYGTVAAVATPTDGATFALS